MQKRSAIERVEILERKVEALETLPERVTGVELQLVQLRDEMRGEFSALRQGLRQEIRDGDANVTTSVTAQLRAEIRAGNEETRRYMRVLHEEVISRLAIIQEGQRPRKRPESVRGHEPLQFLEPAHDHDHIH